MASCSPATTLAPGGCLSAHRRCPRTSDPRGPDEYGPIFDYEVAGLHLAKEPGGGFDPHGARGVHLRHQFPADVGGATVHRFGPTEMMARRKHQPRRREAALDVGRRINLQRALSHELADEPPFDDGAAHQS